MKVMVNKRWGTKDRVLVMLYPKHFWEIPILAMLVILPGRWRKTWGHYGTLKDAMRGKYVAHTVEQEIEPTDYPDAAGC